VNCFCSSNPYSYLLTNNVSLLLRQLKLLELLNASLPVPALDLRSPQLLLLLLLDDIRDLLLPVGVHDLLLLVDGLVGLLEPVLRLGDLLVHLDAALDIQVRGRGAADGVDGAARGERVRGGQDGDLRDGLAGQRAHRGQRCGRLQRLVRGVVEGLDVRLAVVLEAVLGGEGAESPGNVDEELVLGLGGLVVEGLDVLREGRNGDGRCLVILSAGQTLPQLFCEEGHEGVNHGQATLNGCVKCLFGALLLGLATVVEDGLGVLDVGVAQELESVSDLYLTYSLLIFLPHRSTCRKPV
jgi:hypothetical protein